MKKSPLDSVHREFGGRMIDFAGWEMPVQYESVVAEHKAVRSGVGVFDVSHMGQIEILGKDALSFVQRVTCNDVSKIKDGQAQYSAFLTPQGTFVDDIVVYRFHSERIFICVNAATTEKDFAWLSDNQIGEVQLEDRSDGYCQLAIQGPRAEEVLQQLTSTDLSGIRFYWFAEGEVGGVKAIISRTGYTGEDGFELYLDPPQAELIWRLLFEKGQEFEISPAGLAARNSLRLEMRYPLYGHDIDESRTPLEAGLGWIVKLNKNEDFIGKEVLSKQKEEGVREKLVGFKMIDRGVVRDGYPAFLEGELVGEVCSGGFSPTLKESI